MCPPKWRPSTGPGSAPRFELKFGAALPIVGSMRHLIALLGVVVLTVMIGVALDHLGESSRITSTYTALL